MRFGYYIPAICMARYFDRLATCARRGISTVLPRAHGAVLRPSCPPCRYRHPTALPPLSGNRAAKLSAGSVDVRAEPAAHRCVDPAAFKLVAESGDLGACGRMKSRFLNLVKQDKIHMNLPAHLPFQKRGERGGVLRRRIFSGDQRIFKGNAPSGTFKIEAGICS